MKHANMGQKRKSSYGLLLLKLK